MISKDTLPLDIYTRTSCDVKQGYNSRVDKYFEYTKYDKTRTDLIKYFEIQRTLNSFDVL